MWTISCALVEKEDVHVSHGNFGSSFGPTKCLVCILSVVLIGLRVCAISDLSKLVNHVNTSGSIMLFLAICCGHGFELCSTVASSKRSELMLYMRLDLTCVLG